MTQKENLKALVIFYGFSQDREREHRLWFYAKPLSISEAQERQATEDLEYVKEMPYFLGAENEPLNIKRLLLERNEHQILVAQHFCGNKPKSPVRSVHTSFTSFFGAVMKYDPSIPCDAWYSVNRDSLMEQMDYCLESVSIEGFKTHLKRGLKAMQWAESESKLFKAVIDDWIVLACDKENTLKLIYVEFDEIASIAFSSLDKIREVFEDYKSKVVVSNDQKRRSKEFDEAMIKTAMVSENKMVSQASPK